MNWFVGSTFNNWTNFIKSNPRILTPNNWLSILITTINTLWNSKTFKNESKYLSKNDIDNISIIDPIFILGHWRSGTTHLHNILTNDEQFNYPTLLQVTFPNTFHTIQKKLNKKKARSNKRPMDNVQINYNSPGEEEVAVWTMCSISPIGNRLLKIRESYYDRYLTFENADKNDFETWESAFLYFLRKISMNDRRQLLLKSPENTARIKILLDIFPNAKFINIHRNPIDVYKSTYHLYMKIFKPSYYHKVDNEHLIDRIIHVYKTMYDSYFKFKDLIPTKNFVDIGYEELIENPNETIKRIYQELDISYSTIADDKINSYLKEVKSYKKNVYDELSSEMENRIVNEWKFCFDNWNYPIAPKEFKKNPS